ERNNLFLNPRTAEQAPTELSEMHIINFTSDYSYKMATLSLQGIINEDAPKLFAISDENDRFWCQYVINRLEPSQVNYYNNFSALIEHFKDNISGTIVYNPDNLHTRNIGIPLCGIKNAILAEPKLAAYLESDFSVPILDDFNFAEKWDEDEDYLAMYKWLYENYLQKDKLNEKTLALQGPERADLIDLLVADKIFTLWDINTLESDLEELNFIKEIFDFYPQNSPILGYPYATGANEGNTVRLISEAGLYLVASDFSSNLAYCKHLDFREEAYSQDRSWENDPLDLENKIYITFLISDGDNLLYMENRMLDLWKQKEGSNEIPIGWSISPLALKYAPHLIDYYYTNATDEDYFVAGPSGAGYVYPDVMNPSAYPDFLELTDKYMNKLDLTEIWALGLSKPDIIDEMAMITDSQALFAGYAEKVWDTIRLTEENIPIFTLFKSGTEASELTTSLEDIIQWNQWQKPIFLPIWLHCWTQDYEFLEDVVEYAEKNLSEIEFVRPDEFVYLYSQSLTLSPISLVSVGLIIAIITLLGLSLYYLMKNIKWKGGDR
ncbi:MAG: hypothetical protein EU544_03540, partial [Promethearchaeota archaeon]